MDDDDGYGFYDSLTEEEFIEFALAQSPCPAGLFEDELAKSRGLYRHPTLSKKDWSALRRWFINDLDPDYEYEDPFPTLGIQGDLRL